MAIDCAHCILTQGLAFIGKLDDGAYSRAQPPMGAIGGHIRHIIDHFNALRRGATGGWIDYEARERGGLCEHSRPAAQEALEQLLQWLDELDPEDLQRPVTLQLDMGVGAPRLLSIPSCLERELVFVTSHAIHHYALMAAIARRCDHPVPEGFGKAPSTLNYEDAAQA